jgi:hypothetical protein
MNSMNSGSVRTRTVASSVYNMAVQSASLIASNIYQPSEPSPDEHQQKALTPSRRRIVVANLVLYGLTKLWYIWRNHARAKIWDSWTLEQRDEYIRTTKDQGNKRCVAWPRRWRVC